MRTLTATKREAEEAEWAAAVRDEDGQWQQCATKMTRFGLQLVDGHGAPIHGSTVPISASGVRIPPSTPLSPALAIQRAAPWLKPADIDSTVFMLRMFAVPR